MALNTVTLKWAVPDLVQSGLSGTLTITPTAQMSDSTDHELIPSFARQVNFSGGTGQLTGIVANDNSAILPAGTGYLISVTASNGQVIVPQFQTQILFASGATQWLDVLAPVAQVTTAYQYLPLPSGTPSVNQVPAATGAGEASAWTTLTAAFVGADPAGAAAAVQALAALRANNLSDLANRQTALNNLAGAVTAAQFLRGNGTNVTMAAIQAADVPTLNQNTTGTAANITATLDQVPAPAAAVSLNSKKITSLANGTAATDAAAFGQIPLVDATAADITEDGTQAAGATGKWADGGHIHPFAGGMWLPADNGYLGANADYSAGSGGGLAVAGTVYLQKIIVRKPTTITNLIYLCSTVGAGSSTTSFAGLYNSAGTRLTGSSDIGAGFLATGAVTCTLTTPQVLAAGVYYAALVLNLATTQPTLWRMLNTTSVANPGLSAASFRWATNGTGQTSLPASLTLSSNLATAFTFWAAWS